MYGLFQTSFYFGYMALFSIALGIMCGKEICLYLYNLHVKYDKNKLFVGDLIGAYRVC